MAWKNAKIKIESLPSCFRISLKVACKKYSTYRMWEAERKELVTEEFTWMTQICHANKLIPFSTTGLKTRPRGQPQTI